MSIIKRMRKQKAVYWQRGPVNSFGQFTYSDPVQIKCRWDDGFAEYISKTGTREASTATVYVDRPMAVGDQLFKGVVDDIDPVLTPLQNEAHEIKAFDITPNLKNKENLYTAYVG